VHALSAGLGDLAEIEGLAVGDLPAEFFDELTASRVVRILVVVVLALRNRPGMFVLASPDRTAHVRDQHLERTPVAPVEQNTRATSRHGDPSCSLG